MKSNSKNHTIISDAGVDDIIALLLLHKLSKTAGHTLISVFGNAPENYTSQNVREFISFVAPHWLYVHGSKNPLKPLEHPWPAYFHGIDGVCNVHPEVRVDTVQIQEKFPENPDIVSLGPMTDLGRLLAGSGTNRVTVMGGVFRALGNETEYAETNIAFDPDAAAHFFANCQNSDVRVVPLDVTRKIFWTKKEISQIPEDHQHKTWIKKLLLSWFENYGGKREEYFHLHDPSAVYSIFYPEVLQWTVSGVQVVTEGKQRGQTIFNTNNPECKIALEVPDPSRVASDMYQLLFR